MKAIVLPVEGDVTEVEVGDWRDLGKLVGGWIEIAPTPGAPFTMYVNEEGKINGLPFNARADRLANRYRTWEDPLVGPAVLVGPPTAAGDDTEFTLDDWQGVAV
jgi:hypothetical protein